MSIAANLRMSPAEYLSFERASEVRHEYFHGEIREMVGGTRSHARIIHNFAFQMELEVHDQDYWIVTSDMRVGVNSSGLYTYPDVVAVRGQPNFYDDNLDTLINPLLLVEVLSKSTEAYDREEKFELYKHIPTFAEYIMISQDRPFVEQFVRDSQGIWKETRYDGLSQQLSLATMPCRIPLSSIYSRVRF